MKCPKCGYGKATRVKDMCSCFKCGDATFVGTSCPSCEVLSAALAEAREVMRAFSAACGTPDKDADKLYRKWEEKHGTL